MIRQCLLIAFVIIVFVGASDTRTLCRLDSILLRNLLYTVVVDALDIGAIHWVVRVPAGPIQNQHNVLLCPSVSMLSTSQCRASNLGRLQLRFLILLSPLAKSENCHSGLREEKTETNVISKRFNFRITRLALIRSLSSHLLNRSVEPCMAYKQFS